MPWGGFTTERPNVLPVQNKVYWQHECKIIDTEAQLSCNHITSKLRELRLSCSSKLKLDGKLMKFPSSYCPSSRIAALQQVSEEEYEELRFACQHYDTQFEFILINQAD